MTSRRGMTLVEVTVSLTILATAMLSIAAFMGKFAHAAALSDVRNTANELASMRLEEVRAATRYAAIDSAFPGTVALTSPFAGYTRQTIVTQTGSGPSDLYDHKTVTVVVSNPRLARPVRRTAIIAAF